MFEDSVFSSGSQRSARRTRWAVAGALGIQVAVLGLIVVVPLFRPEILPVVSASPVAVELLKPAAKMEVKPRVVRVATASGASAPTGAPAPEMLIAHGGGIRRIMAGPGTDAPLNLSGGPGMGVGSDPLAAVAVGSSSGPAVAPSPGKAGSLRISSGVSSGMLLAAIRPVYPAIARAAHVQGTVVVKATIDRNGQIVGLQVVSGPEMLRHAAVAAVQEARYRPYLLNGEATAVETTISVEFRMGG